MKVLLVGGMTRMPKVQTIVEDFFGKKPSKGKKHSLLNTWAFSLVHLETDLFWCSSASSAAHSLG